MKIQLLHLYRKLQKEKNESEVLQLSNTTSIERRTRNQKYPFPLDAYSIPPQDDRAKDAYVNYPTCLDKACNYTRFQGTDLE